MALRDMLGTAKKLLSERSRRAWIGRNRAHIEIRDIDADELELFSRRLKEAAGKLAHVHWVEVNPHTRRVVIKFDDDAYALETLVAAVEEAERGASIDRAGFAEELFEHPADVERAQRLLFELGADITGFLTGMGLSLSP